MMPTAAKMQKERRVGRTVEPPMPNATKSVMEVMVMVVEVMVEVTVELTVEVTVEVMVTCDGGDGDRHPCSSHHIAHDIFQLVFAITSCFHSGETLSDDEHVVDADAEQEEGEDGVGWAVEEANDGADAVADSHPHHHPHHPAKADVEPVLYQTAPAEHDAEVAEDDQVANNQHPGILEHHVLQRVKEHIRHQIV